MQSCFCAWCLCLRKLGMATATSSPKMATTIISSRSVKALLAARNLGIFIGSNQAFFKKNRLGAGAASLFINSDRVENRKKNGDAPEEGDLIGDSSYIKKKPVCAAGGEYDFKSIGDPATCTVDEHEL